MTSQLVGAFSPYSCKISTEAMKAFDEAMKKILGVTYSPVAVSVQIVAGMNYKFFCNTVTSTRFPIQGTAIVSIYAPLEGESHVTHIQ